MSFGCREVLMALHVRFCSRLHSFRVEVKSVCETYRKVRCYRATLPALCLPISPCSSSCGVLNVQISLFCPPGKLIQGSTGRKPVCEVQFSDALRSKRTCKFICYQMNSSNLHFRVVIIDTWHTDPFESLIAIGQ
jgi:hypothetical protein